MESVARLHALAMTCELLVFRRQQHCELSKHMEGYGVCGLALRINVVRNPTCSKSVSVHVHRRNCWTLRHCVWSQHFFVFFLCVYTNVRNERVCLGMRCPSVHCSACLATATKDCWSELSEEKARGTTLI